MTELAADVSASAFSAIRADPWRHSTDPGTHLTLAAPQTGDGSPDEDPVGSSAEAAFRLLQVSSMARTSK